MTIASTARHPASADSARTENKDELRAPRRGSGRAARAVLAAWLAAWLAACASYRSAPLDAAVELDALRRIHLANVVIERAPANDGAARAPSAFDPRDGLDEAELVAVALTCNPALRAKRFAIGEARALLVTAGRWPNPTLDAFVRPGVDGASGTAFGLDVLFALLRPDETPARRAVAEARVEEARAEIALAELELAADVRRARLAVLVARRRVALLEEEAALRAEGVRLVRHQRELGEATSIAVALVELDEVSIQRALRDGRAASERARRTLNALVGLPPDAELLLADESAPLTVRVHADLDDHELDRRLLAGRFDLHARAAAYRTREAELRLAVARQFPALHIGPSFEKEVDGTDSFGAGASLELPLFDRKQGEIAEREAARDRARAEYVATLHALRARAFEARAALRRAKEEVEIQERESLPSIERAESLFEGALRAREISVFEWISVRTRAVQARTDLLDAAAAYAVAVVDIEWATGMPLDGKSDSNGEDEAMESGGTP